MSIAWGQTDARHPNARPSGRKNDATLEREAQLERLGAANPLSAILTVVDFALTQGLDFGCRRNFHINAVAKRQTVKPDAFTSGPLSYLLRNRFYVGEVVYKGEILPGEQSPIIDRELFDAFQAKLAEQQNNHIKSRANSEALLIGLIFDDRGNRMSPI